MLKIQRASAGSGKTYTLAGTYISLFLTIRDHADGRLRLRTDAEITDSLSHILAVTFTNKATAEMKERIVDKLAAIACAQPQTPTSRIDYLKDLMESTGSDREAVVHAARRGMRALLMDYTAFNVSTIDSFFQTILRTFAYETDMNDSYQLELDNKLISAIGVDETLDQTLSGTADPQTRQWMKLLMTEAQEGNGNWNPFQRRNTRHSIYSHLLENAQKMESEEFKIKRRDLDAYFSNKPDLYGTLCAIDAMISEPRKQAYYKMNALAAEISDGFAEAGLDLKEDGAANLASRIKKSLTGDWNTGEPFNMSKPAKSVFNSKSKRTDVPSAPHLESLHTAWAEAYAEWIATYNAPDSRLWRIYRPQLPYVPLLNVIGENIRLAMEQTNSMQISETNTLLKRIIGNDDTPFIYERLGYRINHYLIDEFQDTSRLQWENFRPLLAESESLDHRNLIIGDAKQSIYRFRNADPSLITGVVPGEFPAHQAAGYSIKENTNWRSARRIVEFNNLFFNALSHSLSQELANLYGNVVQHPHHADDLGYVEVRYYKTSNNDDTTPLHIARAGQMVQSLLDRGYRQRDIAFLSRTREMGKKLVDAFMQYNESLPDDAAKIEFVSDESLLVAKSRSVQILTAALQTVARGLNPEIRHGDEAKYKGVADWNQISGRFAFMSARHPEMQPEQVIRAILENPADDEELSDMIGGMQAVALPSLIEQLIERFVPEELHSREAAFLAAFQDAVLNYCDNNPSDIGSFLEWWKRKAETLSISSPEDVDAVSIMTIHKSKGLEFPVVIVPEANMEFEPSKMKKEWSWVKPDGEFPHADLLPPYIPIVINSQLEETIHEPLWTRLQHMVAMDSLNMAYVALTRASKELYIFAPLAAAGGKNSTGWRNDKKFGILSLDILSNWHTVMQEAAFDNPEQSGDLPDGPLQASEYYLDGPLAGIEADTDTDDDTAQGARRYPIFRYGKPLTSEMIADMRRGKTDKISVTIDKYHVNSHRGLLQYKEGEIPDTPDEDDDDPRSEGNILHDILSRVRVPSDLHRSVLKSRVRGILSQEQADAAETFLTEAIGSVSGRGWFDAGLRYINERPLLRRGRRMRRPDRVVADRNGNAIVIDYKFGTTRKDSTYSRQVQEYVEALRETGRFADVTGFVWYVRLGQVLEVCASERKALNLQHNQ